MVERSGQTAPRSHDPSPCDGTVRYAARRVRILHPVLPVAGRAGAVFQAVDLAVEEGELFALLSPSGCGKSTLLRVIAGLESLSRGQIASDLPARKIGMVFQEPLLLPWLTVAQNVALGLRYEANRAARTPGAVERLLHDFGLASVADAYPESLSGGQAELLTGVQRSEGFQRASEAIMFNKADIKAEMERWNKEVQEALSGL